MRPDSAASAEPISAPTNTSPSATVPDRALAVHAFSPAMTGKVEPVYNFEVEGAHEYYAEGILVHNCRYWAMSRPMPGKSEQGAKAKVGTYAYWKALSESNKPQQGILRRR